MNISETVTRHVDLETRTCLAETSNNILHTGINRDNERIRLRPEWRPGKRFLFPNIGNSSNPINDIQKRLLIFKTGSFINNLTKKLSRSTQKLIYKILPLDDPMLGQTNLSFTKKSLNCQSKAGRAEGIQKVFDCFKNMPKENLYKTYHRDLLNHIKK